MRNIVIIVIIAAIAIFAVRIISGNEDTWICQGNQWVAHGNPTAPKPKGECQKLF